MPGGRSLVDPVDDHIVHLSTHLPVPPGAAFDHFTQNELLESWLAEVADVDPRIGGKYELFWNPADRENNSTIGCRITAFADGQLLAFQWRSPQQFKPFANGADPLTHVVVSTTPEDEGTRVHLVHSGWRSGPDWEQAREWQETAWSVAFQRLEQLVDV